MKTKFSAVVESGSCSTDYQRWEERQHCGHAHHTYKAAMDCGNKHYGAHFDKTGSWSANAAWHGFCIHDQDKQVAMTTCHCGAPSAIHTILAGADDCTVAYTDGSEIYSGVTR